MRSLHACASLMDDASPHCLTVSKDRESGNVDRIVNALRDSSRLELVGNIDGEVLENTAKNRVLRVIRTVDDALDALSPKEVIDAVLERIRLEKHAPRANKTACAALATAVRSRAISFAALGPASAAKVRPKLGDFPIINDEAHALRTVQYVEWTAAQPAARADVWSGVALDSYALRSAAPLQEWPDWRGRPTIVAAPLTEIEGVELGKIKEMDVLAKMLRDGEKKVEGKKRKRRGDAAEEPGEEESG